MIVGGTTLDTNDRPVISPKAEVVDTQHAPIPGLRGAGNCVASPLGQAYLGTLGLAMTFGRIAGVEAAASDNYMPD